MVVGSIVSQVFLAFLHASLPSLCDMFVHKDTTSSETSNVSSDMSLGDSLVEPWTYDVNIETSGVDQQTLRSVWLGDRLQRQLGVEGCQVCEFVEEIYSACSGICDCDIFDVVFHDFL